MYDFFVSHASRDKEDIVDELVDMLNNMGYQVWYDKNELIAGNAILSEIESGLANSYCLLLVLTDNFMKSKWTYFETGHFTALKIGRVIPLLYQLSSKNREVITGILGNRKYVDVQRLSKEQVVSECIRSLSKTKRENEDVAVTSKLAELQKKLASYETVNSDLISLKLKEYLALLNSQSEYAILSAKKLVREIAYDLVRRKSFQLDQKRLKAKIFVL